MKISLGGHFGRVSQDFLDLAGKYDKDRSVATTCTGVFPVNMYGVCIPVSLPSKGELTSVHIQRFPK